jgi:hypothetical protein
MRRSHRPFRSLAFAASLVAIAACSGDDDSASSAVTTAAAPISTAATATTSLAPVTSTTTMPTTASTTPPTTVPATVPATVSTVRQPAISRPANVGDGPATAARQDLAGAGYVEEEFFLAGTAESFKLDGRATRDGRWSVRRGPRAPYETRALVRRPARAADSSGVVIVEWLNVTVGSDADPDWLFLHDELLREGHAWVGVSAQAVGVRGGRSLLGARGTGLVETDPERYGELVHPGDAYAFDIFSQTGTAVRAGADELLGGSEPRWVIAVGESQSAMFLTTYLNAVHPNAGVYDGFLVHSRSGGAPALSGKFSVNDVAGDVRIRTDLAEPVFIFETETDLTVLGYHAARQRHTSRIRTWEVAGTAHADRYLLREATGVDPNRDRSGAFQCESRPNDGPQHETVMAAMHHLVEWVRSELVPPRGRRIRLRAEPASQFGVAIERDGLGNARGGVRTPPVDVPVATLSGDPPAGSSPFCVLLGSTTPFDTATLDRLYPTRRSFRSAFDAAADRAVGRGHLLAPDAEAMVAAATE